MPEITPPFRFKNVERSVKGFLFTGRAFVPHSFGLDHSPEDGVVSSPYIAFPPLYNYHAHPLDLPLFEREIPPDPEKAVKPGISLKSRYLRRANEDTLRVAARTFIFEAIRRGVLGGWLFAEEGLKGAGALTTALNDVMSALQSTPLVNHMNFKIFSRPTGAEEEEWSALLEMSAGFGLSALRDDSEGVSEMLAQFARNQGKEVIIHFSEADRESVERLLRLRPMAVVHLIHTTPSDMYRIKKAGIEAIFTPRANRFFGLKPPILKAVSIELRWHLGSDNAMLTPPDILAEMCEASLIAGRKVEATTRAIQAGIGEDDEVHALFRLPVEVKSPLPTPTLLNNLTFVGYAVKGSGILLIQSTPLPRGV